MGVSTNAVLFYGYCWDEERVRLVPEEYGGDWTHFLATRRGHKCPWDELPKRLCERDAPDYVHDYIKRNEGIEAWKQENRAALDEWYAVRQAIEKEFGVELDSHCSGDYPIPYLAAKQYTARRGYPVPVDATDLAAAPDWDARLDRWLSEMGVEKPNPAPRWWLVSYWSG